MDFNYSNQTERFEQARAEQHLKQKEQLINNEELGDCYEANAMFLVDLFMLEGVNRSEMKRYRLCHGEVLGAEGSPVAGKWIAHAWVELDEKFVIDYSNGNKIAFPVERIEHRMRRSEAKRYTVKQMMNLLLRTEHYGPWTEEERAWN